MSIVRDDMRQRLFSETFKSKLAGYNAIEVFHRHAAMAQTDDPLALIQYLDLKTYLIGDINTKVDRASMAHSLEVREPLMDHPLVEWLLKKTMEARLPRDVLYREKMGFAVPLERWFRGPLQARIREAIQGERLRATGIFDAAYLRSLVDAHQSGKRDYSTPIWTLLMFDAFLRNVLDKADDSQLLRAA